MIPDNSCPDGVTTVICWLGKASPPVSSEGGRRKDGRIVSKKRARKMNFWSKNPCFLFPCYLEGFVNVHK